jgi:PAS domain S-box-containing protein
MTAAARVMDPPTDEPAPPLRQFMRTIAPDGRERTLRDTELIVSKTDLSGRITYANSVFLKIAMLEEHEALGAPHSLIRHPDMPRCVFKLLWDRVAAGHEVFAYVNNLARDGANYWVFAHVTPTHDAAGRIVGYHSNRRRPDRGAVEKAAALYRDLCTVERAVASKTEACARGLARLNALLDDARTDYDAFVFSL